MYKSNDFNRRLEHLSPDVSSKAEDGESIEILHPLIQSSQEPFNHCSLNFGVIALTTRHQYEREELSPAVSG
ncbi:hypothetical protein CEXT_4941 [Caerostris extrusa]|uniref:Uncharacterized protein n=1 Tax=Caerostris extrusa TaxID=172846 RepID=A0AAV4WDC2_CAEEX|nr:hypothetical protein CEXT_4941 [Caerostris extrusa]